MLSNREKKKPTATDIDKFDYSVHRCLGTKDTALIVAKIDAKQLNLYQLTNKVDGLCDTSSWEETASRISETLWSGTRSLSTPLKLRKLRANTKVFEVKYGLISQHSLNALHSMTLDAGRRGIFCLNMYQPLNNIH
ncbi:hypothetical protein NXS19_001340 [Fusarium pseudograminearum]|nr:hypothetical protein NXS19_001340 [Fusarium pseudograminearum]